MRSLWHWHGIGIKASLLRTYARIRVRDIQNVFAKRFGAFLGQIGLSIKYNYIKTIRNTFQSVYCGISPGVISKCDSFFEGGLWISFQRYDSHRTFVCCSICISLYSSHHIHAGICIHFHAWNSQKPQVRKQYGATRRMVSCTFMNVHDMCVKNTIIVD